MSKERLCKAIEASEFGRNAALSLAMPTELAGVINQALNLAEEKSDGKTA